MSFVSPDLIEIRNYIPASDKDFIYSTWLKNYKDYSYFAKRIKYPLFFREHQKVIDHLLSKQSINVKLASPRGEPDIIIGYLVYENKNECNHFSAHPLIHFLFVKDIYRNMGIATHLFNDSKIDPNKIHFSHWTLPVNELIERYPGMIYNPYSL